MVRVAILHVDAALRERLRLLVEARGFSVVEVATVDALTDAADETPIALVLVASETLRAVGLTALRTAAAGDHPHAHVPVVLLAERGAPIDDDLAEAIDEILWQPVDARELALRLESGLARRRTTELVAVASHELRSPIHAIAAFLDLLARSELPTAQREMVDGARTASRHLLDLVEDLLEHARLGQGPAELDTAPFSIRAVVKEATTIAEDAARPGHVAIVTTFEEDVADSFRGDGPRVRQIVINLASNALKFASAAPVRVRVRHVERELELEVVDDGPGVPEAARAIVFEPFRQADATVNRRFGGTGLGLAIARSLARRMGGDIVVRAADEGKPGAVFVVRLPLGATVDEAQASERPLALLADGDAIHRGVVSPLLERLGYRVETVSEGIAALLFAIEHRPALVVIDAELAAVDAAEVARRLRAAHADMPIVAFGVDVTDEARKRALDAGVSAVVAKPVAPLQLQRALRHATLPGVLAGGRRAEPEANEEPSGGRARIDASDQMHEALRGMIDAVEMHARALESALAHGDMVLVAEVTRTLRGAVHALNARGLEAVLRDLEQAARAGDAEECRRAHEAWQRAMASLRDNVERFLERAARAR